MLELRDRLKEKGFNWPRPYELDGIVTGTVKVKVGFPSMLRNGVIMDMTSSPPFMAGFLCWGSWVLALWCGFNGFMPFMVT